MFGNSSDNGISYGIQLLSVSNINIDGNTWGGKASTFNGFALRVGSAQYSRFTNNNLRSWTENGAAAFTTNGTTETALPGSATTIEDFPAMGTGCVAGFNTV
jgi:hypothetical protein